MLQIQALICICCPVARVEAGAAVVGEVVVVVVVVVIVVVVVENR